MARSDSRKISNFPANTAIPAGSFFEFISGGVNYKISDTDFNVAMGVTGTIVQEGAPTGTPILDVQGTVNRIRSIEDGAGIVSNVSPENGVTLAHNFGNGDAGINMIQNITNSQPIIPSLLAGAGMSLSLVDDHVVFEATGIVTSTKTVLVNVLADFPTPVAGVITLAADTEYLISNDVNIGVNTFALAGACSFRGTSATVINITCTKGSGSLFTVTGMTLDIIDIRITATGMSLATYDGSSIAGFSLTRCTLLGFTSWGTYTDTSVVAIILCFADALTSGINLAGTQAAVLVKDCLVLSCTGAFIDLGTSVLTTSTISGNVLTNGASGTIITGLAANANVVAGGLVTVLNNRIFGGLKLAGVTVDDAQYQYIGNDSLADTRTDGLLSMQSNATATTITTQSVPVLTAGTWVVEEVSQMTGTTGGRLTLDTVKDSKLPITMSVTMEPVSGGSQTMGACVAVNGSVIVNSIRTTTASAGNPVTFMVPWQETLSPTDFVEVYVSNESGTTNVLVSSAIHRIN